MAARNTTILLVSCPKRRDLAPAIVDFVYSHGGDILHADQHHLHDQNLFLMRVEWAPETFDLTPDQFRGPIDRWRRGSK
jgi:formyltetrahydrofolate deformylase